MAAEQSFLGTGWSFPPAFTPGGAEVETVSGVEDIHQSLQILLSTRLGERVMQDEFGCDLHHLLFEEIDRSLINSVSGIVSDAILYHEARIKLDRLDVSESETEPGLLLIGIDYTIRSTNSRFNMVYPFYINEAATPAPVDAPPGGLTMPDFILIEGDKVQFLPNFGPALVVVQPGELKGSGPATLNGKKICVDGDEKDVSVSNCDYVAPPYLKPGKGTLKIAALAGNQKATKTSTGGKAVLLKGGVFTAKFEVQTPAQQPPPPAGSGSPDTTPQYSGQGSFTTTNTKLQGS